MCRTALGASNDVGDLRIILRDIRIDPARFPHRVDRAVVDLYIVRDAFIADSEIYTNAPDPRRRGLIVRADALPASIDRRVNIATLACISRRVQAA